jgi:predicted amidohydrolase YtcJ
LATLYKKTRQGELVSPTKPFGLPWPLRYALMLVNGKRSDDELRAQISAHGDEALQSLLESGFIEVASVADDANKKTKSPKPAEPARDLARSKRLAVRWLADHMGPFADPVNLKIERAKNSDELLQALHMGRNFVTQQLGATMAGQFDNDIITPLQP